jgi:glucose-6-phosphate dehydrogenase assembly protein OpcA
LNWIRIQRWRGLIAEMFDGEWSKYLKNVKKISIAYGEGGRPTRSFFLACWLASRLNLKYTGKRISAIPNELKFEGPQGEIEVIFTPVPIRDTKVGRIFAVGLTTDGDQPAIFTVIRDEDPHVVSVRSEVNEKVAFARSVSFEHLHSNQLLNIGLKHLEEDLVWMKTLQLMGTVLEKPDLTIV